LPIDGSSCRRENRAQPCCRPPEYGRFARRSHPIKRLAILASIALLIGLFLAGLAQLIRPAIVDNNPAVVSTPSWPDPQVEALARRACFDCQSMEDGLLTVTGGKLTTFDLMAHSAMRQARRVLPGISLPADLPPFDRAVMPTNAAALPAALLARLAGRHGAQAEALVRAAADGELDLVADMPTLWGEVRWGARSEWVIHLENLMLRRTRLGLLLSDGGSQLLESIGTIVRPELDWTREHWQREVDRYRELWRASYAPPSRLIHPV
jgi:glycerol-3-phosphate dehydrogenase